MSHPFPAGLLTSIQSASSKRANLVKVTLRDQSTITLTDWDEAITADFDGLGSMTYSHVEITGLSAFASKINGPIDDTELTLRDDGVTFSADMWRAELFQGAVITIGICDPESPADADVHRVYDVGQTRVDGAELHLELLGLEKRLEQTVGVVLTANCRHEFGGTDCGIAKTVPDWGASIAYVVGDEVKPTASGATGWFRCTVAGTSDGSEPSWPGSGTVVDGTVTWQRFAARTLTGTVSGVTDKRVFLASGIIVADDHFAEGLLTWLTGANAGQRRRVRSDDGLGTIGLHIPMLYAIQTGDTFTAVVGCRHRYQEDCITKHEQPLSSSSLTIRFGGFPFLAPEDVTITAEAG